MKINSITIDTTDCISDLCLLGVKYPTDKSPYNEDNNLHKHAYTGIYDMLFSSKRYERMNFGEIGIYNNHSMQCWREYFPNSILYGFENNENYLKKAMMIDNLSHTYYLKTDVKDVDSINKSLCNIGFDILIDDSTHEFEDQIRIINIAYKYLKPGGMLIVEDVFLSEDEQKYKNALSPLKEYFSSATFITANHKLKHSPGWNNDKLLVLWRNDKPI